MPPSFIQKERVQVIKKEGARSTLSFRHLWETCFIWKVEKLQVAYVDKKIISPYAEKEQLKGVNLF